MILQGEENDGVNIVLIGGALFIVFVVGAIIFAAYRVFRRAAAGKQS